MKFFKIKSYYIVTDIKEHKKIKQKFLDLIDLMPDSSLNTISKTDSSIDFDNTFLFNTAKFNIGSFLDSEYLAGQVQEVVIYNRALSSTEISDIRGYLNLKYKIY